MGNAPVRSNFSLGEELSFEVGIIMHKRCHFPDAIILGGMITPHL